MRWTVWTFALILAVATPVRADTISIVAFGDSWTYGRYVDTRVAYPAQLQAALRAAGYDVKVTNAGSNGDRSIDGLRRLGSAVPDGTQIALVEFGINDARKLGALPPMDDGATTYNLDQIVRKLQARGILVMLIAARGLDFTDLADKDGVAYEQWPALEPNQIGDDGFHPNPSGYAAFVADMLPGVEALIKKAGGTAR